MSARLCEPVVVHCQMDALLFDFAGIAFDSETDCAFFYRRGVSLSLLACNKNYFGQKMIKEILG